MKLDTQDCRRIAEAIGGLKGSKSFSNASLNWRHAQIQDSLGDLQAFFLRLAELVETNEDTLSSPSFPAPVLAGASGFYASGSLRGNLGSLVKGRTLTLSGAAGYVVGRAEGAWHSGPFYAGIEVSGPQANVQGSASLRLMKNRTFQPELKASVYAGASLASGAVKAGIGNDDLGVRVSATGEVGSVYGQARAAFSVDEQVISAQVGAAAARGECSLAFDLADLKITIGLSGSAGSVEAGFEYASEPGSWQVGVNGALFAGAGLKIRVEY